MFFGYSVRSPHRTAKPSRGCLRVVGLKAPARFSPCKRRGTKVINEKPKLGRGCRKWHGKITKSWRFIALYGLWRFCEVVGVYKHRPWLRLTTCERIAPSTVRPLARDLRVLIGWPFPLGFGLDGRLLLARRGRVYV